MEMDPAGHSLRTPGADSWSFQGLSLRSHSARHHRSMGLDLTLATRTEADEVASGGTRGGCVRELCRFRFPVCDPVAAARVVDAQLKSAPGGVRVIYTLVESPSSLASQGSCAKGRPG